MTRTRIVTFIVAGAWFSGCGTESTTSADEAIAKYDSGHVISTACIKRVVRSVSVSAAAASAATCPEPTASWPDDRCLSGMAGFALCDPSCTDCLACGGDVRVVCR